MKTAKEFLLNKDIKVNLKNLTNKSWDKVNTLILEVMEEYAQYKINELNKSDVVKSVCKHPINETITDKDGYKYCKKCCDYYSM